MIRKLIPLILTILIAAPSLFAVTDKEMEEARAITAITYLRYANDGSGYLDSHHPKTMAELEKILKTQEKTNLASFKAVKTPTDYASWTKEQLVAYWGGTFFSSPGLIEKGKVGKSRTRSRIQAMNIAAPAPKETAAPKAEETKPESPKVETPKSEEPKVAATETPVEEGTPVESAAARAMAAEQEARVDSLIDRAAEAGLEEEVTRRKNDTPLYIAILAVLVCVVIWLVFYASKTMKQTASRRRREEVESGTAPMRETAAAKAENAAMRERYSEALAQKNADIRQLQKELENAHNSMALLQNSNDELRAQAEYLKEENERLRNAIASATAATPVAPSPTVGQAEAPAPVAPTTPAPAPTPAPAQAPAPARRIYLGRVNQRGLFVRADKNVNVEHSVYMLETRDGYSGSYRVLQEEEVDRRLLSNPAEWLAGGASGDDLENPGNATIIHTQTPGTAIFEGGVWKVMRKARIYYGF
ncbi:MAG: hypothetical protein HDS26_05000 [Bacteroides sp.]|nr:hypothetical protein [Bacteroides sp.]